jgi:hypothetical protein
LVCDCLQGIFTNALRKLGAEASVLVDARLFSRRFGSSYIFRVSLTGSLSFHSVLV